MLECVVNISEGRDQRPDRRARRRRRRGPARRPQRPVPPSQRVHDDRHRGAAADHPSRGRQTSTSPATSACTHASAPSTSCPSSLSQDPSIADAVAARDASRKWAGAELGIPCFCYGPERTLPEVRRRAWTELTPGHRPAAPHPTAGAICVGRRDRARRLQRLARRRGPHAGDADRGADPRAAPACARARGGRRGAGEHEPRRAG